MKAEKVKVCDNCEKQFLTRDNRQRFCSRSCAATYNGKLRKPTDEQKRKASESLKLRWKDENSKFLRGKKAAIAVGKSTKGKHKRSPKNLFELSMRTVMKIMKRLDVGCSICGWKDAACDIHHIHGRKGPDANDHKNLTYVCPNCHRKIHAGLIRKEDLIPLSVYIEERWLDHYYG